ncbi:MAG: peptidylprolyl isomerase, partial [Cyanobium sp.]
MTTALMETDAGTITLELFDADAPGTVANFVKLAGDGFYDGLAFHRVIDGFMAQGGCPNSREGARGMAGTGGPGDTIPCEINPNKHKAGTLAMA